MKRFLKIYDEFAEQAFYKNPNCESKLVATSSGQTQVHACGDPSHPPVILFPGVAANSLSYGDWILPALVKAGYYAVAVDNPYDVGRSIPKDGDPSNPNAPKTQEDLAQWLEELISGLNIQSPVSLVGFSYGCFVAFSMALHRPELVEKLVILAPAGVFSSINPYFLIKSMFWQITGWEWAYESFFRFTANDPNFKSIQSFFTPKECEHIYSLRDVGGTQLTVLPISFSDDDLKKVIASHKTLLCIGENDVVTDPKNSVERAQAAGATVKLYKDASHFMFAQTPAKQDIEKDVVDFMAA